jgi:hypothetical protein
MAAQTVGAQAMMEQIQNTLTRAIRELDRLVQLAIAQVMANSGQRTAMLTRKR